MPFGIIDMDSQDGGTGPSLPGTELLLGDRGVTASSADDTTRLKTTIYRGVETVLVPQPSENDANDPLLWPVWQKEAAFWTIFLNAIIFAIMPGPMMAPATYALASTLDVTLTNVARLGGYQLLVVAALGPVVSVLAQKYGKRPQFLFASTVGTLGTIICIVGSQQSRYNTLLAGRIIQGLGVTAWESLSLAAVGDMFYLYERGWRTAVIVCSLACMASMVSIIGGVMTQNEGYRNLFVAALPFNAAGLLATILLVPETQFIRVTSSRAVEPNSQSYGDNNKKGTAEHVSDVRATEGTQAPRKTYVQRLSLWSGVNYTQKGVLHLLAEIFIHLANPAVIWILMVSAVLVSLFVVSAYILAQVWSVPPYNLDIAQNGYFWTGPLLGGLLAVLIGPLCDWSARWLARLNRGIFEAEFRIPVNVLGALFCSLGWFLFMWVVDNPQPHGYYLGSFCYGCICFGISVPSTSAGLYILDSFPGQATEVFVLQMMLKNFLFYGFSNFINTWATEAGAGEVFRVFGIVSISLLALCIPMYVLGKLNRKIMYRLYTQNRIT